MERLSSNTWKLSSRGTRKVISDEVTTERCTNWFLIKPDAVLSPDSLHTHEWKCASYLQLLLVCRPQRCLLSTLVKHQSCRTEVTQQVIVTHAEIAASQHCVIASACPGVVNGQSFLKFCSLYSLSIFSGCQLLFVLMVTKSTLTWKESSPPSWPDPSPRWYVHTWITGRRKRQVRNCNTQ